MKKVMKALLLLGAVSLANPSEAASYLRVYLKNNLSSPIGIIYSVKGPFKAPNWHPGISSIAPGGDELIIKIPTQSGKLKRKTWHFIATLTVPGVSTPAPLDIKVDKDLKAFAAFPGISREPFLQGHVALTKLGRPYGTSLATSPGDALVNLSIAPSKGDKLNLTLNKSLLRPKL